jgi:hypothetical protein
VTSIRIACLCLASAFCAVPARAAVILITQDAVLAGDVTPGDTPGFPVTLSISGSYRLDSNLALSTAVNGIEATAADVTIDFNGFKMSGGNVANNGVVGFQRGLTVRGGTIRAFTKDAINVQGRALVVERMRLTDNGRHGVNEHGGATAGFATVSNSTILQNLSGILCGAACRVENSTISYNTQNGITMSNSNGLVLGNAISYNGTYGVYAQETGLGNNMIGSNTLAPIAGSGIFALHPNKCYPQAC